MSIPLTVLPACARDHADVHGRCAYDRQHVHHGVLVILPDGWCRRPARGVPRGVLSQRGRVAALAEARGISRRGSWDQGVWIRSLGISLVDERRRRGVRVRHVRERSGSLYSFLHCLVSPTQ